MDRVIAQHGTSLDRWQSIRTEGFKSTTRRASWLGFGSYFFVDGPVRSGRWAEQVAKRHDSKPVVITAEIDLSDSINLLDIEYWDLVREAYADVPEELSQVGPSHLYDPAFIDHEKVGFNYRDCAAMNIFIGSLTTIGQQFRSIVAAFPEGKPLAPDSWLFDEACVMINVVDPSAIHILDATELS